MIYPAIEEDIKWWENDDDNIQIDADERKDYERRILKRLLELRLSRDKLIKQIGDQKKQFGDILIFLVWQMMMIVSKYKKN
jgi:hypothetical protein